MKATKKEFYSNGKLLLSGEYVVLDGALSLAIPTKYGQSLTIEKIDTPELIWNSFDEKGNIWYEGKFHLNFDKTSNDSQNDETTKRLIQIFKATQQLNPNFLKANEGFKVSTKLTFPKSWGLGTSSTLINNIADWANIDAFKLLELTFGGSGYDIACAKHNTPITYLLKEKEAVIETVNFNPIFKDHLYFVYLNKKQNSRIGIAHYRAIKHDLSDTINTINAITLAMANCNSLEIFESLVAEHEMIIAETTKQDTVKSLFFNDFKGTIKSLGAWGGDFVLVCSNENPTNYFIGKGFTTIIPYCDMVL